MSTKQIFSALSAALMMPFAAGEGVAATSCTTDSGAFRVDLVALSEVSCSLGICTRWIYEIVPLAGVGAAHASLLHAAFFASGDPIQIVDVKACDDQGNCVTDGSVTEIEPGDADEPTNVVAELTQQGARINAASVLDFAMDILGSGLGSSLGSVAVQASGKGNKVSSCVIDAPALAAESPRLATTGQTCFEKNGCTACFVEGGDGLVFDAANSNIGGPGCPQGKVMSGAGLAVTLPAEEAAALVEAIPFPVGSVGGTASSGSCPFIYTRSDGSIGGFCDCFGVFDASDGLFHQRDPISLCGPPTGCCTAGPFGGANNSCGLSPVRNIAAGFEGPLCPAD